MGNIRWLESFLVLALLQQAAVAAGFHVRGVGSSSDAGAITVVDQPRQEKQWAAFIISYQGQGYLQVKNAALSWGKWYKYPDKSTEIKTDEVNTWQVHDGEILIIAASGRASSPSGTEGTFELWDESSRKVLSVYFDCPFIGSNNVHVQKYSNLYIVDSGNAPNSGPIGNFPIDIYKRSTGATTSDVE